MMHQFVILQYRISVCLHNCIKIGVSFTSLVQNNMKVAMPWTEITRRQYSGEGLRYPSAMTAPSRWQKESPAAGCRGLDGGRRVGLRPAKERAGRATAWPTRPSAVRRKAPETRSTCRCTDRRTSRLRSPCPWRKPRCGCIHAWWKAGAR